MPKCPACGEEVQANWVVCPICATRLGPSEGLDSLSILPRHLLDQGRYLWERKEGGKFVFENFQILKNLGINAFGEAKPIRKQLGDYAHVILVAIRQFSFAYLDPNQIHEIYNIGKLQGYYNSHATWKEAKLGPLIENLGKTGLFWAVFENKIYQQKNEEGWKKAGAALLKQKEINKKEKKQRYVLRECPSSIIHANNPVCFMITGCLCGQAEAVSGSIWDGKETKCQSAGADCNEIEIWLSEKEEKPPVHILSKEELGDILQELAEKLVDRKPTRSKEITDDFYIVVDQIMNYYLISLSPGHAIMSKYAGRIWGERIAEKAQLQGQDVALAYLEDMFLYLKAGIIRSEKAGDRIIIKMKESVYASGVSNIHQNLCVFLAGIIEGTLNKATAQKWDVSEMKCLASGFPECEFWCKKI